MTTNHWKIHRVGFVNYWLYDEEEFVLKDGKWLLRGTNGSGKSTTMQSILPIMIDGKKSPERLDPFGGKNKTIRSLLLASEDLEKKEGIGYIYVEFKKGNQNIFRTIGQAFEAKNDSKNINSWGFILLDNRRVLKGVNHLSLYKEEVVNGQKCKFPLTENELKKEIGESGFIAKNVQEYQEMVNKYLFGFESTSSLLAYTDLMMQLRSPKLSNSYKPSVVEEWLLEALPKISDAEIAPISEIIEGISQIEDNISRLKRDKKSIETLVKAYNEYNDYTLYEKANLVKEKEENVKKIKRLEKAIENEIRQLNDENEKLQSEMKKMQAQKEACETEYEMLSKSDIFNVAEDKNKKKEELEGFIQKYNSLEKQIRQKEKEQEKQRELKYENEKTVNREIKQLAEITDDISYEAEESSFSVHQQLRDHFQQTFQNQCYDFAEWKEQSFQHLHFLKKMYQKLQQVEQKDQRKNQLKEDLFRVEKTLEENAEKLEQAFALYDEKRGDVVEEIDNWQHQNEQMILSEDELSTLMSMMHKVCESIEKEEVEAFIRTIFQGKEDDVRSQIRETEQEVHSLENEKTSLEKEILVLRETKEVKPALKQSKQEAMNRLSEKEIPFIPFYEAVEFKEGISDAEKQAIESIAIETGLLTSLITKEEDEEQIANETIVLQKGSYTGPHHLLQYLEAVENDQVPVKRIEEILKSIAIHSNEHQTSFINGNGSFANGFVKGFVNGEQVAMYIGTKARQKNRLDMMNHLQEKMDDISDSLDEKDNELSDLKSNYQTLKEEYRQFPNIAIIQKEKENCEKIKNRMEDVYQPSLEKYQKQVDELAIEINQEMYLIQLEAKETDLILERKAFEEAIEQMNVYRDQLTKAEISYKDYLNASKTMHMQEEQIESLEEDIILLKGESNLLDSKIQSISAYVQQLESQLEEMGEDDVIERLEWLHHQQKMLNENIQESDRNQTRLEMNVQNKIEKLRDISKEKIEKEKIFQYAETIFVHEWKRSDIPFVEELKQVYPEATFQEMVEEVLEELKEIGSKYTNRTFFNEKLNRVVTEQYNKLTDYNITKETLVESLPQDFEQFDSSTQQEMKHMEMIGQRDIVKMEFQYRKVSPMYIFTELKEEIEEKEVVLKQKDKDLFENVIIDILSDVVKTKIQNVRQWEKEINIQLKNQKISSDLNFEIKWVPNSEENDNQLHTRELVNLLETHVSILNEKDKNKISKHFRSKMEQAKILFEKEETHQALKTIIKEIIDYRKWYRIEMHYSRRNKPKSKLTDGAFGTFSGGEKALAVYMPLLAAIYSKLNEAGSEAPRIIALDEAFAGIDDNNINILFEMLDSFGFDYILTSQSLWGCYEASKGLTITEVIRSGENVDNIEYYWNGKVKKPIFKSVVEDLKGSLEAAHSQEEMKEV